MIRLKDIDANQTFYVIPSSTVFDQILLTDEQTKKVINIEFFSYVIGDYTTAITSNFNGLIELNHTYTLKINNSVSEKTVFKDKVIVTNQNNLESYSTVSGLFKSHETTNDFIVI